MLVKHFGREEYTRPPGNEFLGSENSIPAVEFRGGIQRTPVQYGVGAQVLKTSSPAGYIQDCEGGRGGHTQRIGRINHKLRYSTEYVPRWSYKYRKHSRCIHGWKSVSVPWTYLRCNGWCLGRYAISRTSHHESSIACPALSTVIWWDRISFVQPYNSAVPANDTAYPAPHETTAGCLYSAHVQIWNASMKRWCCDLPAEDTFWSLIYDTQWTIFSNINVSCILNRNDVPNGPFHALRKNPARSSNHWPLNCRKHSHFILTLHFQKHLPWLSTQSSSTIVRPAPSAALLRLCQHTFNARLTIWGINLSSPRIWFSNLHAMYAPKVYSARKFWKRIP